MRPRCATRSSTLLSSPRTVISAVFWLTSTRSGSIRGECLLDVRRAASANVTEISNRAAGQHLQRVNVAARRLTAALHDQDVIAELLRLAQNLRCQHDRAAARRFLPQARHDRSFQDRIHPGRKLVEKYDRRVDHENLCDLDSSLEAAAQIHHLPVRLRSQSRTDRAHLPFASRIASGDSPWNLPNVAKLSMTDRNSSAALSWMTTEMRRLTSSGSLDRIETFDGDLLRTSAAAASSAS